ncbi:MAG: hypothetical protein HC806_00530 [Anaerolineae bacterium]|nr:hypothetical protein [Anaerolineae bacterium]
MFEWLKNWFIPPNNGDNNPRLELTRMLWPTLGLGALLSFSVMVIAFITKTSYWEHLVMDALIIFATSLFFLVTLRLGYLRVGANGGVIGFGFVAIYIAVTGSGVKGISYGLFLLLIILSALLLNRRAAYIMAVISSLIGLGLVLANQAGILPSAELSLSETSTWLIQCAYFFMAAVMLDIALRQTEGALGSAKKELTERKRMENEIIELNNSLKKRYEEQTAQLAASEERYRLIANVSSDYVFSSKVDQDGNINHDWAAGAFETIMGCNFDEFLEQGGWKAVLHPNSVEQDRQDIEKTETKSSI